jgi:hypothetical protein
LTWTIDPLLSLTNQTPAAGISSDLANILAQNSTWYGWTLASGSDAEIQQAAQWTEGNKKLFIPASTTSGIASSTYTANTTDVGSLLYRAGYKRTALLYSPAGAAQGAAAAWMGGQLPQVPGSNNWAFKNLNGITADSLTDTQRSNCVGTPVAGIAGKNVNVYIPVGGVNVTEMGTTASGQYIDITVGIDWLQANLQTNLYSLLVNSQKIPYTDAGVTTLMQAVRQTLDQGAVNGLIDGASISVTAPAVLSVSTNQRANRIAPTVSFGCRLQGAFNSVVVSGTVTV